MLVIRFLLLLLIFGNLLLYFWGQGMLGGQTAPGEPERLAAQLEPEKLRVTKLAAPTASTSATQSAPLVVAAPAPKAQASAEAQAAPAAEVPASVATESRLVPNSDKASDKADKAAKPEKPARASPACLAVSGLTRDQVRMLSAKIQGEHGALRAVPHVGGEPEGYWVMHPALPNRAAAERKASELRGLGVTDLFVMNDDSAYPNAISLGLFKSREKADDHLKELRAKGVQAARVILREGAGGKSLLELSGPREVVSARVARIESVYRGTTHAACKAHP